MKKKEEVANKKIMTKEQPTVLSLTHSLTQLDIIPIFGSLLLLSQYI